MHYSYAKREFSAYKTVISGCDSYHLMLIKPRLSLFFASMEGEITKALPSLLILLT